MNQLMISEQIIALVSQDPQEMVWIEGQVAIFMVIFFALLFTWLVVEYYRYLTRTRPDQLIRLGMDLLFSVEENST